MALLDFNEEVDTVTDKNTDLSLLKAGVVIGNGTLGHNHFKVLVCFLNIRTLVT